MKQPGHAAALTLLIAISAGLPCPALSLTLPPARDRAVAMVPLQQPSTPSQGSPRERLLRELAIPDTAVVVLATGVLLIFLECNLPGAIIPGAFGLLLLLAGSYGLALHPLRPAALLILIAAGALLAFSARTSLPLVQALAGTSSLIYGLWTLISPANLAIRVHLPIAVCVGVVIGPSAFFLDPHRRSSAPQ